MKKDVNRTENIFEKMKRAKSARSKIVYDREKKRLSQINPDEPEYKNDKYIQFDAEDMTFGGEEQAATVIVIAKEQLNNFTEPYTTYNLSFKCQDEGDAYVVIPGVASQNLPGSFYLIHTGDAVSVKDFGKSGDKVRIVCSLTGDDAKYAGCVNKNANWMPAPVSLIPLKDEIFSRNKGILESDLLAEKNVTIFGEGSVGSTITLELSKCGVQNLTIGDHDRLESGNVSRHSAGLRHIGRYKVKVIREMILQKNPYAKVKIIVQKVGWDNLEELRPIIAGSDLVYAVPDDHDARLAINFLCVEEKTPCVFSGASKRAVTGQVLFYQPGKSPCYQCFCKLLPEMSLDEEIATQNKADRVAYSDRPVPVEPGLSIDIAPISLMAVKVGVQYLIRDIQTTLRSLDEDLSAPLYLWVNRREGQFKDLIPLESNIDGFHILRWYGIDIDRDQDCPICGNLKV